MTRISVTSVAALALGLLHGASATLDPIIIDGNHFFYKTNGSQFYMKGVAYQSNIGGATVSSADGYVEPTTYKDPLADTTSCKRDIPYMQQLGVNVIRTYALDPTLDHDDCMQALDAAGIYVITDLSEPSESINRDSPQWNTELYARYTSVIDTMSKYDNTLGYIAGNEITNNLTNTDAAAYVKAAVRDMKAYIKQKAYRPIGVGYASDDDATVRTQMAAYMNCGTEETSIDFWGYNIYSWCGNSSFQESGYSQRVEDFANYTVPVFFAEFGCNTGGGANRKFTDVPVLYSNEMTDVFSGGIVYEYFQDTNDYGLVTVDGSSVSTLDDFNALKTQYAAVSPTSVNTASFKPSNTALASCPSISANYWAAVASPLPPTPNQSVCDCMVSSLQCRADANLDTDTIGTLFGQICGYKGSPCSGIASNSTTGSFGAYSMCNATEQLSYVMNAYYNGGGAKASDACDFGGKATLLASAPSAASTCKSIISQATSGSGSSGSSSSSSSSASKTSKKANDASLVQPVLGMGKYFGVAYLATLLVSVGGMVLL